MIILGRCPHCGGEETISVNNRGTADSVAICSNCSWACNPWYSLPGINEVGGELIPVDLSVMPPCHVHTWFPHWIDRHPFYGLMVRFLNVALMLRFDIKGGACFAYEGGIEGTRGKRNRRKVFEFRNWDDDAIGLYAEPFCPELETTSMLKLVWKTCSGFLMSEELVVGDDPPVRGAVLKCAGWPDRERQGERVLTALCTALAVKTGDPKFPNRVLEHLEWLQGDPFGYRYLVGAES